jgi:hypothetical protein
VRVVLLLALSVSCGRIGYTERDASGDIVDADGPSIDSQQLDGASAIDGPTNDGSTQSCAQQYGAVSGYVACEENQTNCVFVANAGSCSTQCGIGGGTCLEAWLPLGCPSDPSGVSCGDLGANACRCTRN